MGGSSWSDEEYKARVTRSRADHGTTAVHTSRVRAGRAAPVNRGMDPRHLKAGRRESRDSEDHPNSIPVLVALDVTGSMGRVVHAIHDSLPRLMGLLVGRNYLADPQICFCGVGDAYTDKAPLQVGQFESCAAMEGDIAKLFIEGLGGGQNRESYELLAYFACYHVDADAWERRNRKGYLVFIGDEKPYDQVKKSQVEKWISGAEIAEDMSTADLFEALQQRWHVIVVVPEAGGHGTRHVSDWEALVGRESVVILKNPAEASELIAAQIGIWEGSTTIDKLDEDLASVGSTALATVSKSVVAGTRDHAVVGAGAVCIAGSDTSTRF